MPNYNKRSKTKMTTRPNSEKATMLSSSSYFLMMIGISRRPKIVA